MIPIAMSPFALGDFVGVYLHSGFGTLHVECRTDCLWFRLENDSRADGPLVRYSGLSFEHQIPPGPGLSSSRPKPVGSDFPWIRFNVGDEGIVHVDWHAWFGTARFRRCETAALETSPRGSD